MNKLKWWLRVVGTFYLLIGAADLYGTLFNPQFWVTSTDELAIKALSHIGLAASAGTLILAVTMLIASRDPLRAEIFIWYAIALEFFQWIFFNALTLAQGVVLHEAPASIAAVILVVHLLFGVTGIAFLRQAKAGG